MNFINKHGIKILIGIGLLIFVQTCRITSKINSSERELNRKIDSVYSELDRKITSEGEKTITEEDMKIIIKETPAWTTLEIEELSDKNRVPINKLKHESEKN